METAVLSLGMVPLAGSARPHGVGAPGATDAAAAGGLFAGMLAAAPGRTDPAPAVPGGGAPAAPVPGLGRSPLDLLTIAPGATLTEDGTAAATGDLPDPQQPEGTVTASPCADAPAMAAPASAALTQATGGGAAKAAVNDPGTRTVSSVNSASPAAAGTTLLDPAAPPSAAGTPPASQSATPPASQSATPPAMGGASSVSAMASSSAAPAAAAGPTPAVPAPPASVAPEAAPPPGPDQPIATPSAPAAAAALLNEDAAEAAPAASDEPGSENGTEPETRDGTPTRAETAPDQPLAVPTLSFARPSLQASSPLMPTDGADAGTPDAQADGTSAPAASARPGAFAGLAAEAAARLGSATAANAGLGARPVDRAANVHSQVLQQVAGSLASGRDDQTLTIRLHPESLGQVDVEFNASQDRLSLVLRASTPEAEHALRANMRELTDNIIERATRFQHVDIRVELRDGAEPRPDRSGDRQSDQKQEGRQEGRRDNRGDTPGRQSDGHDAARAAWVRAWTDLSQEV